MWQVYNILTTMCDKATISKYNNSFNSKARTVRQSWFCSTIWKHHQHWGASTQISNKSRSTLKIIVFYYNSFLTRLLFLFLISSPWQVRYALLFDIYFLEGKLILTLIDIGIGNVITVKLLFALKQTDFICLYINSRHE